MPTRSLPERLDDAVDSLLAGERPVVELEMRPLLTVAGLAVDALPPIPAGTRFEAELGARLAHHGPVHRAADAFSMLARRELAHPVRLLAAGAVSTAAVGMTVTAVALWRSGRLHPAGSRRSAPRLLSR